MMTRLIRYAIVLFVCVACELRSVHAQPVGDPGVAEPIAREMARSSSENEFAELFARIDTMREQGSVTLSETVGGSRGGAFEVVPEETSVLVGFVYTVSRLYAGHLTIKAVRPVFRGVAGEVLGEWCGVPYGKVKKIQARDGYAVGGIIAKSGNRVDGLRLIYMKVQNGRLNPDDSYRSAWIGGLGGSPETLCAAGGHPLIGIYGRRGADLDAIGFVQANATRSPASPTSLRILMPQLTGNWAVTYTNNTRHTRKIHKSQQVNDNAEIVQRGNDILIVFPNVIERLTLANDRLFVEHFNPASTYPAGNPVVMGIGRKSPSTWSRP